MSGLELNSALQKEEVITDITEARRELDRWKVRVEQADDLKTQLIMQKLEVDQEKNRSKDEMKDLHQRWDQSKKEGERDLKSVQEQIQELGRRKRDLTDKLRRYKTQLESKRSESAKLQQKFKIRAEIPDSQLEFVKPSSGPAPSNDEPIRGRFSVSQQGALLLRGGQALITFEEERVVSQILKMDRCSVSFEDTSLEVTPKRIRTEPTAHFQIHLDVSRTQLDVSDVFSSMTRDRVRDRLELSFSKPSRGGAEVRAVEYDDHKGAARVTFIRPGVAETLALSGEHLVELEFETKMKVTPVYEHHLHKFQSFCGAPKRTLLLDHIRDTGDEEEVQDQLEIHFQKPSNGGGEIEHTKYISTGKTLMTYFCNDA